TIPPLRAQRTARSRRGAVGPFARPASGGRPPAAVVRQRTRLISQLHQLLALAFPELALLVEDISRGWVLGLPGGPGPGRRLPCHALHPPGTVGAWGRLDSSARRASPRRDPGTGRRGRPAPGPGA